MFLILKQYHLDNQYHSFQGIHPNKFDPQKMCPFSRPSSKKILSTQKDQSGAKLFCRPLGKK